MKGIPPRLVLILLSAVLPLAPFKASQAGVVSEFSKPHLVDQYKLKGSAQATTHRFGEYQLVEVFIPAESAKVTVHDLRFKGVSVEAYSKLESPETIAVIGGGFFGYNKLGKETPIGLTREGNVRKVALMPWSHGGVLTSDGDGVVRIFPAESASQGGRWQYALQSKPIIILNSNVDVAVNLRDADFNRVAVGITPDGDLFIVGLFHSFGQAATLVQFARIYKHVADQRGLKIHRALAMDGGAGAQIYLPQYDLHFGDTGLSYFPNAIRIEDVRRSDKK